MLASALSFTSSVKSKNVGIHFKWNDIEQVLSRIERKDKSIDYLKFFGQIRVESMMHGDELLNNGLQILFTVGHQFHEKSVGGQTRFGLTTLRVEIGRERQEAGPLHTFGDQLRSGEQEVVE